MTTPTLKEAAQQALATIGDLIEGRMFTADQAGKHAATIDALRAALAAQQELDEPQASPIPCAVHVFGKTFERGTPFCDVIDHVETERMRVAHQAAPEPVAVPQGWKLVPVEANMLMAHAALGASRKQGPISPSGENALPIGFELWAAPMVYRAMLSAAPESPTQAAPDDVVWDGWQPIEAAPKDGTRVLLCIDHGEWGDKVWTGLWGGAWMVSYGKAMTEPTHWMPLPPPPAINAAMARKGGE